MYIHISIMGNTTRLLKCRSLNRFIPNQFLAMISLRPWSVIVATGLTCPSRQGNASVNPTRLNMPGSEDASPSWHGWQPWAKAAPKETGCEMVVWAESATARSLVSILLNLGQGPHWSKASTTKTCFLEFNWILQVIACVCEVPWPFLLDPCCSRPGVATPGRLL